MVDPLTLAVVSNALVAIAEEMCWVLKRTSFSENVREGEDCSASVFDADGNMVGQSNFAPGHLGATPMAVAAVLSLFPKERMRPGDAFLVNDPSMNSGHLPDVFSIAPIFHDHRLIGFAVASAHHVDMGGAAPGSQAVVGVVDIHQEGLRILPVQYYVAGEPNEGVFQLLAGNVRTPQQMLGDLKAQYNANLVGAAKVRALVERYGFDAYRAATDDLLQRTEAAMRAAIAAIPPGVYEFTDYLDDSGPGTEPIRVHLQVRVTGDRITVDFAGSSPASRSAVNSYLPFTFAMSFLTLKSVIAPDLPANSGCMRPVEVVAPPGSFFNPTYPAPCGGRVIAAIAITDAILGAMAQAVPDRVQAASSQLCITTFGGFDERRAKPFVYYDLTFGSSGARPHKDGCDGLIAGLNTANIPVEIHEALLPVRIERLGFVCDSGGPGRYRGGLAVRRDVQVLAESAMVSSLHDRERFAPWGLEGGGSGLPGRIVLNSGRPGEQPLHSKGTYTVHRGDVVSFQVSGGGGRGDPLEREPAAVLRDVLEGWVSREAARSVYGVVIHEGREAAVDVEATAALRRALRDQRG